MNNLPVITLLLLVISYSRFTHACQSHKTRMTLICWSNRSIKDIEEASKMICNDIRQKRKALFLSAVPFLIASYSAANAASYCRGKSYEQKRLTSHMIQQRNEQIRQQAWDNFKKLNARIRDLFLYRPRNRLSSNSNLGLILDTFSPQIIAHLKEEKTGKPAEFHLLENQFIQQKNQAVQNRKQRMYQFKQQRKQEQQQSNQQQAMLFQKNKKLPKSQQRMHIAHRQLR